MALLQVHDIEKSHGDRRLLRGVTLTVEADTRIGIVGANGCGKSTFLRVLAGLEDIDAGRRLVEPGVRIGLLLQEAPVRPGRVRDVVRGGLVGRDATLAQLERIHAALAAPGLGDAEQTALLREMAAAEERLEHQGGHDVEHRVEALVEHVGLPDPDADATALSGGERRRVELARVLLSEPDLLLLDEPTNHLDAFVVDWLEDELLRLRTPLVMVTHDRYFLDRVVDRVVEIERGELFSYDGGYAGYLTGKAAREVAEQRAETGRQSVLRRETEWMRRGPPARSTKAKARIDRYHALLDAAPESRPAELAFRIPPGPRLGTRVLRARGLTLRAGDRTLVERLDLDVGQGARLGIVGPNGAGKSTLLRALIGERAPDAGTVEAGETVRIAAIDQQRRVLDPEKTVVEELGATGDHVRVGERAVHIASFLDGFLFPGERKHTPVKRLSGGERNRILLAKLLLQGGNVLVLDEPTNDLDLPTLRALEEALLEFAGTVIVVSHDRWFLDRVATEIVHLDGKGRCVRWGGDVSTLLARVSADREAEERATREAALRATSQAPAAAAPAREKAKKRLSSREREELAGLPARIEAAEARQAALGIRMAEPALYRGPAADREAVQREQGELASELERLYARWEELEARA